MSKKIKWYRVVSIHRSDAFHTTDNKRVRPHAAMVGEVVELIESNHTWDNGYIDGEIRMKHHKTSRYFHAIKLEEVL